MSDKIEKICNLVDEANELIDPNPDIHELFTLYDHQFFSGVLSSRGCLVEWSKRMTSCAGICVMKRDGHCCIRLSEPLLKLRKRKDLIETLLHEMIHGYLFLTKGPKFMDRDGHGPDFQSHMNRINAMAGTSISIYHNFHAEVRHYKQHWWRCTGPCQLRAPYHGWVKRSMNRAPGPNDFWWKQHAETCDGIFVKVKEPGKPSKSSKTSNNKKSESSESNAAGKSKIDQFFPPENFLDDIDMPGTSQQYDYNDQIQQNDDEISIVAEIEPQPRPVLQQIGNDKQPLFPGKGYRLDGK